MKKDYELVLTALMQKSLYNGKNCRNFYLAKSASYNS